MRELDLHGVKHEDVDRLVENFILLNNLPVTIITGNSQKMAELVKNVIERNNLSWGHVLPNWGAIVVNEGKESDE